jgi:hypothetical protein
LRFVIEAVEVLVRAQIAAAPRPVSPEVIEAREQLVNRLSSSVPSTIKARPVLASLPFSTESASNNCA